MEKALNSNLPKNLASSSISSLTFEGSKEKPTDSIPKELICLKCDEIFKFPALKDEYLAHLYLTHRLVIADVEDIADLQDYLEYWIKAFADHELEEYCTTMLLDQLPDGTPSKNERYYLLCDILPQDYELRKTLHTKRMEKVLAQHQFERTDRNFSRECLYCRDVIKGLRSDFLEHLFNKHFLQLGKPENLVFVDDLIDIVQQNLETLTCLFCEKIFKDRGTLKEHMRKKGHKRINPNIKMYDRFFLVNYKSEKPKHVKNIKHNRKTTTVPNPKDESAPAPSSSSRNEETILNSDESDSEWSDWDGEKQSLTCLYCTLKDTDFGTLKQHMADEHGVQFDEATSELNFYQKIKVVNYIRRQIHILRCVTCDSHSETIEELLEHMSTETDFGIGEKKQWDQPEFFFPTYEDDGVLCLLDNNNENDDSPVETPVMIISEDPRAKINKDAEELSLENFKMF